MTGADGRLLKQLQSQLDARDAASIRRRLSIVPEGAVDFSSNDFLSLSKSHSLRSAFLQELHSLSDIPLGSGGSRLLDGNSRYAEHLEHDIAAFHNAPSALLFNSGFDANSGMFACLPRHDDVILYDQYIHASVHEGMRLSRAGLKQAFSHNDLLDFERCLRRICESDAAVASGQRNVFIAVESLYSMDGDLAPIRSLLDVKDRLLPNGNGHLIVDEAHSTGVYGRNGRGLVCDLAVEDRVFIRLHTFGKALSSGGAVVLCHPVVRDYLINYARSLIYTTALGLPSLAMIRTVYRFLEDGTETSEAQSYLWRLIEHMYSRLAQELRHSSIVYIPDQKPNSPIFSLITSQARNLAAFCQSHGFVVRAIMPPTVPTQRVRVCLHAGNTAAEIDNLVDCIVKWQTNVQTLARL